jgi:hypothetical protein
MLKWKSDIEKPVPMRGKLSKQPLRNWQVILLKMRIYFYTIGKTNNVFHRASHLNNRLKLTGNRLQRRSLKVLIVLDILKTDIHFRATEPKKTISEVFAIRFVYRHYQEFYPDL